MGGLALRPGSRGIIQEDYQLGGVRIHLNIPIERLHFMFEKKAVFDMSAWIQDPSPFTAHMRGVSPLVSVSLEPGRWGLQAAPLKSARFAHGLDKVVGASSVTGRLRVLPNLQTPLGEDIVLSNVDFTKCYVELDIGELSVTGGRQRHVLSTVPLRSQTYGQTCAYHPQHLDFSRLGRPHPPFESTASAFKKRRQSGHSILHRSGRFIAVFSSRPYAHVFNLPRHEFSRRTSCDLGEQGSKGCVS